MLHVRLTRLFTLVVASWLLAAPAVAPAASAATERRLGACDVARTTPYAPDIDIQTFDSTDVTGGIAALPGRIITGIEPGEQSAICVGLHNRTGSTISLDLSTVDIGAGEAGAPAPVSDSSDAAGAAAWITLPPTTSIELKHGELAWVTAQVAVPHATRGGSNYAGIVATIPPDELDETTGTQVQLVPRIIVQVYFDVVGDLDIAGELVDVSSPRVVWWDGLGMGDLPGLSSLRGRGNAPIRFDWKNTGSLTSEVSGHVRITADLGGREVVSLPVDQRYVLRDSQRSFRVSWKRDIPIAGRFTPTVRIDHGNGEIVIKELPAIWVIPAWWYLVLLALAIAIPVTMRRRSKRRYRALMTRLEAAEEREVSAHSDVDWDSGDEWSDAD